MTARNGRRDAFRIEHHGSDVIGVAAADVEIDLVLAPGLRAALATALDACPQVLVIDLTAVAVVDSACLGELSRAAHTAARTGTHTEAGPDTDEHTSRPPVR